MAGGRPPVRAAQRRCRPRVAARPGRLRRPRVALDRRPFAGRRRPCPGGVRSCCRGGCPGPRPRPRRRPRHHLGQDRAAYTRRTGPGRDPRAADRPARALGALHRRAGRCHGGFGVGQRGGDRHHGRPERGSGRGALARTTPARRLLPAPRAPRRSSWPVTSATGAWLMPSTSGRSRRSAPHRGLAPTTTPAGPGAMATTKLYERSATGLSACCTVASSTTPATTRPLPGASAKRNFHRRLDKLQPWDV